MTRGNQRDLDRKRGSTRAKDNAAKANHQIHSRLNRKESDADIMRRKNAEALAKKAAEEKQKSSAKTSQKVISINKLIK